MTRRYATGLVLAGHRVRVSAEDTRLLRDAVSVLVPLCAEEPVTANEQAWEVRISLATGREDTVPDGHPVLAWPHGMRLTVIEADHDVLRLAGRFRADSPAAVIEVDRRRQLTQVQVPGDDPPSRRWPDWILRAFFGSRLLADGWTLLHAAAVRIPAPGGYRALLVLAGPRGGKSTLAHRACTELGAQFMADDLVVLRAGTGRPEVAGWPTRVCIPAELLDDALLGSLPGQQVAQIAVGGRARRRVVVSPPEYQRLLGIDRGGPAPVGGVIAVVPARNGPRGPAARSAPMDADLLAAMLADAARVEAQRLMTLDLLGVAGCAAVAPALRSPVTVPAWGSALAGIRGACLELGDAAQLPFLPVWDLLKPHLPWLGEQQRQ